MASFLKDNDDLRYYLERGLDWDSLIERIERFGEPGGFADPDEVKEFYRQTVELVGEFVAEEVAPEALAIDAEGVRLENGEVVFPKRLDALFEKINQLELHGLCLPRELGGLNAPMLIYFVNTELFARADVSVMAHHGFHAGIAMALLLFSMREKSSEVDPTTGRVLKTRFAAEIDEIRRGAAWGCMDITEPDAGSDMASIKTRAEQDADGRWTVTGQKIFITSGHGKYHFVIARTDPNGLDGLSMFMVPAYESDQEGSRRRFVTVDRVEEKMGHHGSATCALSFDRAPAHLVGKRGEGFKYMLILMNNARLGVGFECIGLCEAAYRLAKTYAAERRSMGKTLDRHEMIADYLDEMRSDIIGLRALAMHGAYHEELAQKLSLRLAYSNVTPLERKRVEREIAEHKVEARRVTPLLKYLAAEKAVEMARRAVQILGGVGYMREYGAEKLLRDATVMPIYEGTSQIQALMAMKDTLAGIFKSPQAFVKRMAQTRWRALSTRDPIERRVARLELLALSAEQLLLARTAGAKFRGLGQVPLAEWPNALVKNWDPKRDFAPALLHAERLTRLLADVAQVGLLWEQSKRHPERTSALLAVLERAEPRCRYLLQQMSTTGARVLGELEASDPDAESREAG